MLVYIERDWAAVCGPRTNVPSLEYDVAQNIPLDYKLLDKY